MSNQDTINFLQNNPAIQVTDSNPAFSIFHHSPDCNDESDPLVKSVRGWILNNNSNEILVKTFSYIPEITINQPDRFMKSLEQLGSDIVFTTAFEGSMITIWSDGSAWHLSTAKKLNAFSSRWGSEFSLGQHFHMCLARLYQTTVSDSVFDELFNSFCSNLNPNIVYVLHLRSWDENRIVCRGYEHPECFFIGSFDRLNNFTFSIERPETIGFEPVPIFNDIENIEMLVDKVHRSDPFKVQGVMIMNAQGQAVKLYSQAHWDLIQVRGFSPNHLMRYITILKSKDQTMLQKYKELYSERSEEWKDFHRVINSMVKNVQSKYIKRYVEHSIAILPSDQHGILKECYNRCWVQTKQKVTPQIIETIIFEYDTPLIHKMFELFKKREATLGNGNHVDDDKYSNLVQSVDTNRRNQPYRR